MRKRMLTFMVCGTIAGSGACYSTGEREAIQARIEALNGATVYIETGAEFPGEPLLTATQVEDSTSIAVELIGGLTFAGGGREAEVEIVSDGIVDLPSLIGGEAGADTAVVVRGPAGAMASVAVTVLAPGAVADIRASLDSEAGVVAAGPGFVILNEDRLQSGTEGTYAGDRDPSLLGVCWCPFVGRIGKLTIDASCRNRLAMWVIPEDGATAFTPATATIKYEADGFKVGSSIYKIDGSTCNTLTCGTSTWSVSSCVNNLAAMIGKSSPYWVPAGTFGNEPPSGAQAQYVR